MTTDEIIEQALALPRADQLKIAAELFRNPHADDAGISAEAAWDVEIARRIQGFENGTAETLTRAELRKRFRAKLERARDAESTSA